ncbi:MAG: hypothetical protein L7V87_14850 [Verrucomicrobiales bacterium]|jgi:hypothetical protein|nr:hypothetical protein [Verrucomicrobiales bacterium]
MLSCPREFQDRIWQKLSTEGHRIPESCSRSVYNEKPEDHGLGEDPKIAFLQKPCEAKKLTSYTYELLQEAAS